MGKQEFRKIESWCNKNGVIIYVVALSNTKFVIERKLKGGPAKTGKTIYSKKQLDEMYTKIKELKIYYYNHYTTKKVITTFLK